MEEYLRDLLAPLLVSSTLSDSPSQQCFVFYYFRGSSGGTGTGSKVLEGTESEQAWEDMGLGDDFAITDWMIK